MRSQVIILLVVCIIAFLTVSILYWNFSNKNNEKYAQQSVMRNFNTPDEERALTAAESVDYAAIKSAIHWYKRFNGSNPEEYNSETYLAYTYANFIDTEVINYYQARYDYQQKQSSSKKVTFNYVANVTYLDSIRVFNDPSDIRTETVTRRPGFSEVTLAIPWQNSTVVFYGPDNYTPLTTGDFMRRDGQVVYLNHSEYQVLQPEFDLTFSNCYIVEMELQYHEYYAPLAAFWSDVHQIVILDQNLVPVWIGIKTSQAVS